MKIASLGPHIVVPAQEENMEMAENLVQSQTTVAPPSQNESAEHSTAEDGNKGRFNRIYDLIKEAEKKKQIRAKADKRRMRVISAYLAHVKPTESEESIKGGKINQAS